MQSARSAVNGLAIHDAMEGSLCELKYNFGGMPIESNFLCVSKVYQSDVGIILTDRIHQAFLLCAIQLRSHQDFPHRS